MKEKFNLKDFWKMTSEEYFSSKEYRDIPIPTDDKTDKANASSGPVTGRMTL